MWRMFKSREEPVASLEHPILGGLLWDPVEKEWRGSYNGFVFSIPRYRQTTPDIELLDYAVDLLGRKPHLLDDLECEKQRWIGRYPDTADEVLLLQFEEFALYKRGDACLAFVMLAPESSRNSWRIEFAGHECMGLGFDS